MNFFSDKLYNKNLKLVYQDPFRIGNLYSVCEPGYENEKPIVFINGQYGHTAHHQEFRKLNEGIGKKGLVYKHGTRVYDKNIHTPFIWSYSYETKGIDPNSITLNSFTESLIRGLENCDLQETDIIGVSCGAGIGIRASKDNRVDQVIALNPPFPRCFLADTKRLLQLFKEGKIINPIDVIVLISAISSLKDKYGFVKDYTGENLSEEELQNLGNWEKILLMGGTINDIKLSINKDFFIELASLMCAKFIKKYANELSDGVVSYSPDFYEKLGLDYVEYAKPYHHYAANRENVAVQAYNLLLQRIEK